MSKNEEFDAVMRRIEKLLAIANCPGANPNEAAAAAGMAERIMRKYQLEHSDIIKASLLRRDEMDFDITVVTAKTNGTPVIEVPLWANQIGTVIAELCEVGCALSKTKQGEKGFAFFGLKNDVQMASWMLSYLAGVVNSLCFEYRNSSEYKLRGRKAMASYRMGVSHGIIEKLKISINEKKDELKSSGTDLVIVKQSAIKDHFGFWGESKKVVSKVKRGSSYFNGVQDGKKVDLNRRGIEGGSTVLIEKRPGF